MGLKLLHSADWHLDSPFAAFPDTQRAYLRAQQRKIPEAVADLCLQEQCDLVLLSGDLFDGTASRETLDTVKASLKRCGVPVFISPGNHDCCRPGSPWLDAQWPENVFVFSGSLESAAVESLDCRVWGAAFTSMDCPPLLEHFQAEGTERWKIGVFHGDPLLANSPCNPVTAAQVRTSALDYLALGHIHKAGSFRAGSTLCSWPGCPMGRGWDETGEKSVSIVTLEPDAVRIHNVSLGLPCFREESVDITLDAPAALERILPPVPTPDFYRIRLRGRAQADLPRLYSAFSHLKHLQLIDQTEAPLDIWGSGESDTLEGTYFRLLKEQLEDADPETARRITLAAEISRLLLEGKEVSLL